MIDKVIKEFNINEYTYKLGYLYGDKAYPRIQIYKNEELLAEGYLSYWADGDSLDFVSYFSSSSGVCSTIKEMFNKLRQYIDIPKYIENEYESLFIMYKLNNFKI